jgi:exopolysaccharide biosynthesis polyprenyl glycosylphosphotransferase
VAGSTTATSPARADARVPPARGFLHWLHEGRGYAWSRLVSDVVTLTAALFLARELTPEAEDNLAVFAFPVVVIVVLAVRRMYDPAAQIAGLDRFANIVLAIAAGAILTAGVTGMIEPADIEPTVALYELLLAGVLVTAARGALFALRRRARTTRRAGKRTLIIGAGEVGALLDRRLHQLPELGLMPIGFIDPDPVPAAEDSPQRSEPVLGSLGDLPDVIAATGAEHVILAFTVAPDRGLRPVARLCDELGVEVSVVPRLFDETTNRIVLEHIGGLPVFALREVDPQGWQFTIKHTFDRISAAIGLLLLSPLLLVTALAVKLSSPGPVLFRQQRLGRDGRVFDLLKFRSMRAGPAKPQAQAATVDAEHGPGGVEGDDRRTKLGIFLRKTSIDELPQLLNVLRGEMSLVGPRPERPEFVAMFEEIVDRYADRHRVKSGITGWAQVNKLRGKTSMVDRVEWDNYYIQNWSLWLDVKILLMTPGALLRGAE